MKVGLLVVAFLLVVRVLAQEAQQHTLPILIGDHEAILAKFRARCLLEDFDRKFANFSLWKE